MEFLSVDGILHERPRDVVDIINNKRDSRINGLGGEGRGGGRD